MDNNLAVCQDFITSKTQCFICTLIACLKCDNSNINTHDIGPLHITLLIQMQTLHEPYLIITFHQPDLQHSLTYHIIFLQITSSLTNHIISYISHHLLHITSSLTLFTNPTFNIVLHITSSLTYHILSYRSHHLLHFSPT